MSMKIVPFSRKLVLSGRTEADRKVMVAARTSGVTRSLTCAAVRS
jgi:hypothetical protein